MKKRYRVEPSRTLLHNGEYYEGGQVVSLEEDAARPLLELGAILELEEESEQESQAAPLESEAEPENESQLESRRRGRPRRS